MSTRANIQFTPEKYGAKGDGVTDDQAAFTAMIAAMKLAVAAGFGAAAILGARTYYLSAGGLNLSAGCSMIGQGYASVLKTDANNGIIQIHDAVAAPDDILLRDFTVLGSGAGANQRGIEFGFIVNDGANRINVVNVTAKNMGDGGFSVAASLVTQVAGPCYVGCRAINCVNFGFQSLQQSSYLGCSAAGCGEGLRLIGGNAVVVGGDFSTNTVGIKIRAGGNDGHSIITGVQINHCGTFGIDIDAITHSQVFVGCHIFQSPLRFTGNPANSPPMALVKFEACIVDPSAYTFDASHVEFDGCLMQLGYANAITEVNNPQTLWHSNCLDSNMQIPDFVGSRLRLAYVFPSDADQTLTPQQSVAEVIEIAAGVLTAPRNIYSHILPNKGQQVLVVNRNAQDVGFAWASGTGLAVPAGQSMLIGADGTNAVCEMVASNVAAAVPATINPTTLALSGLYRGSYAGAPWLGTASAGTSGAHTLQTPGVGNTPAVGPNLNGYATASFDGVASYLVDTVTTVPNYITVGAYRVVMLVYPTAAPAPAGLVFNNPGVLTENGGNWGIVYNSNGFTVYHNDGAYKTRTLPAPINQWHLVDVSYDGANLTLTVDGVSTTLAGVGAIAGLAGAVWRLGANFNHTVFFTGLMLEMNTALTQLAAVTPAQWKNYVNERYRLAL